MSRLTSIQTRLRNAFRRHYLLSLWLPFLVTLVAVFAAFLPYPWKLRYLTEGFGSIFLVGLLYLLFSAIIRLSRKRIGPGLATLACFVLAAVALIPALLIGSIGHMVYDDFANDLTIPKDLELSQPGEYNVSSPTLKTASDSFQITLLESLASPPPAGELTLSLPSLASLQTNHPDLLAYFLSAHPGWRVYSERGDRHATRRWRSGDRWDPGLNNYYSSFHLPDGPRFQSRTNIGLDGKSWAKHLFGDSYQHILPDTPTLPELKPFNGLTESRIAVPIAGLLVEQFEQSAAPPRPITVSAFAQLEAEFQALAADPSRDQARSLLPEDAISRGSASIELSGTGGNYDTHIRCNPGESGSIFLKAFEVTRDQALSAKRLKNSTNERIGWSDDPTELFLSATSFTIREGEWNQYYAARFEVWFQADSGAPEHKLIEHVFKIEGWSH